MAPSGPFTGGVPEAPRGGTHILQGVVADRVKIGYECITLDYFVYFCVLIEITEILQQRIMN